MNLSEMKSFLKCWMIILETFVKHFNIKKVEYINYTKFKYENEQF